MSPPGARIERQIDLVGDRRSRTVVDCSPFESVTVSVMRYRVKPLKSCPVVGIVNVPLCHAGDGRARMHVPLVQEIDVPGEGAGRQRAVLDIRRVAAERDDVARPEE